MTLVGLQTSAAWAFEPLEAVELVQKGIEAAQQVVAIYESVGTYPTFEPTTADRINDAVNTLANVVIDAAAVPVLADAKLVTEKFAMAAHNPMPSAAQMQDIDSSASSVLNRIELFIGTDKRYSEHFGVTYNLILPIYVQVHLRGSEFGIFPIGASLGSDVKNRLRDALRREYAMVGGIITGPQGMKDTTRNSMMFANVKDSAYRGSTGDKSANCRGNDDVCSAYFQTNARVQAIQAGAWGLVRLLGSLGEGVPTVDDPVLGTVSLLPSPSWLANWKGLEDAVWTSMQEYVWGKFVPVSKRTCPEGSLIKGVWQMPNSDDVAFLCQKSLRIGPFVEGTSTANLTPKTYTCSSGFCNYGVACDPSDWMVGAGFGDAMCYRRLDNGQTTSPTPTSCGVVTVGPNAVVPAKGLVTTFEGNTFLTAYDPTSWTSAKRAFFTTCGLPVVRARPPLTFPIYRYFANGRHFYTTKWSELGDGNGWTYEGVIGRAQNRTDASLPLYRYYDPVGGNHFYTTNWAELEEGWQRGWWYEGVEAYVPAGATSATTPLHRYYNPTSGDFFYTTNFDELGNGGLGYVYAGVQCNVFK